MGTPDFAATLLEALLDDGRYDVVAAYSQPDRPSGRGRKLLPTPVKAVALSAGIPVLQPSTLKDEAAVAQLAAFRPDFLVVAAYGMILPAAALAVPRLAPVNVHTSLLPAYRGSAPIQRAIMNGEKETGVSIMRMDVGLDTGPVYESLSTSCATETAGELFEKLAGLAGPLLLRVLDAILDGSAVAHPQEGEPGPGRGYAAKVGKEEGHVDVRLPAKRLYDLVRGLTPDPGAHVELLFDNRPPCPLLLEAALPDDRAGEPGTVRAGKGELRLFCGEGSLVVKRLRPQGKKSMDAAAFLNGLRLARGEVLEGRVALPGQAGGRP